MKTSEVVAVALGILVVPLIPAVVIATVTYMEGDVYSDARVLAYLMPIFYFDTLLPTIIIALPIAAVIRSFGLAGKWSALIGGYAIGTIVDVGIRWPNLTHASSVAAFSRSIVYTAISGFAGAISGLVFWAIWKRGASPVQKS